MSVRTRHFHTNSFLFIMHEKCSFRLCHTSGKTVKMCTDMVQRQQRDVWLVDINPTHSSTYLIDTRWFITTYRWASTEVKLQNILSMMRWNWRWDFLPWQSVEVLLMGTAAGTSSLPLQRAETPPAPALRPWAWWRRCGREACWSDPARTPSGKAWRCSRPC